MTLVFLPGGGGGVIGLFEFWPFGGGLDGGFI